MTRPDPDDRKVRGRRVAFLALAFALLAHGCFIAAVSLTKDPF